MDSYSHKPPPSYLDRKLTASGAIVTLTLPTRKYNTLRGTGSTSVFDALPGSKVGVGEAELVSSKPRQLPKALLPKDARRPSAAAAQQVRPGQLASSMVEPRRNSAAAAGYAPSSSRLTSQLSETTYSGTVIDKDLIGSALARSEHVGSMKPTGRYDVEHVRPRQRSVVSEPNAGLLMLRQLKADKVDDFSNRSTNAGVSQGDDDVFTLRSTTDRARFDAPGTSSSNRRTSFADTLSFFSSSSTSGSGEHHDASAASSRPNFVSKKSLKYHRFNTLDDETTYDVTGDDVSLVKPASRVDRSEAVRLTAEVANGLTAKSVERCEETYETAPLKVTILREATSPTNDAAGRVEEPRVLRVIHAASTRLTRSTSVGVPDNSMRTDEPSRDMLEHARELSAVSRDLVAIAGSGETVDYSQPISDTQRAKSSPLAVENSSPVDSDVRHLNKTSTKRSQPILFPASSPLPHSCEPSDDPDDLPPLPASLPPPYGSANPPAAFDGDFELRSTADNEATISACEDWNGGSTTLTSGLMGWYLHSTPASAGAGVYNHRPTDSTATVDSGHGSTTSGLMSDSHDDNGMSSADEPDVVDFSVLHQSPRTCVSDDLLDSRSWLRIAPINSNGSVFRHHQSGVQDTSFPVSPSALAEDSAVSPKTKSNITNAPAVENQLGGATSDEFGHSHSPSSNGGFDTNTAIRAKTFPDAVVVSTTGGVLDRLLVDNGTTLADLTHGLLSSSSLASGGSSQGVVQVDDMADLSDNIDVRDTTAEERCVSNGEVQRELSSEDERVQLNSVEAHPTSFDVTIVKGSLGLGFCIEGGVGSAAGDRPLKIRRLFRNIGENADGLATLKAGDEITAVNGISFGSLSHYEAWNRLKALPDGTFVLSIRR